MDDAERIPTVSYRQDDVLVELIYDPIQRKTSFVYSPKPGSWETVSEVTLASGQKLVPYASTNNLIAHRCVLLPSGMSEAGTEAELVADLQAFIERHVSLSPLFLRLAAHYVLLTWVFDAFSEVPYLRLRGDYGTGKTRALLVLGSLCYKGFFAAGASTVSPIFHTLDRFGGTLVLDEADLRFSDATADLVKVFNNGNVKGMPVLRSVGNRNREFNPVAFNVFGPKIVAMRGAFADEALESRFITEETDTHGSAAGFPLQLPAGFAVEAQALRNRLLRYRLCRAREIVPRPEFASPDLEPRRNQISLPLLAVIEDPDLRTSIQNRLLMEQNRSQERRARTVESRLLVSAIKILREARAPISIKAVTDAFNGTEFAGGGYALSPKAVGAILRRRFLLRVEKMHGVYCIARPELARLEAEAARRGLGIR